MRHIVVDIETNGASPFNRSMVSLGAVVVEDGKRIGDTFYIEMRPIWTGYDPAAYEVNGFTHEQAMTFERAETAMQKFNEWLKQQAEPGQRLHFVSDNAGFDWMFVCVYMWSYCQENPFGFSPMSLTWYFKGQKGIKAKFGQYRANNSTVKHTHNALDDAMGNAQALIALLASDKSR